MCGTPAIMIKVHSQSPFRVELTICIFLLFHFHFFRFNRITLVRPLCHVYVVSLLKLKLATQ